MGFLSGILLQLLEWFLQKLIDLGIKEVKEVEEDHAIEKQAQDDETKLQGAKSDQDKASAATDIIKHTFGS